MNIRLKKFSLVNVRKSEEDVISLLRKSTITLFPFRNLRNTLDIPLLILESIASRSVPLIIDKSGEIYENRIFNDFIFDNIDEGIRNILSDYKHYLKLVDKFIKRFKFETTEVCKMLYDEEK